MQHVKLKKDYIPGLEELADLVAVGGRRSAFHLACSENEDHVRHFSAKPRFCIVASLSSPCISTYDLRQLNKHGERHQTAFALEGAEMDVRIEKLFKKPMVVEVNGVGFVEAKSLEVDVSLRDYESRQQPTDDK